MMLSLILPVIGVGAMEYTIKDRTVAVRTEKNSFSVRDGVVTQIPGMKTDGPANVPAGLGVLRDVDLLRSGHMPWGEPALNQNLKADFSFVNYFRPGPESKLTAARDGDGILLTWTGLGNGKEFLPDAVFRLKISEREDGAVRVKASGSCKNGGVFAAVVAFAEVDSRNLYVPTLGGMRYPAGSPAILTFGSPPYLEAPFAGIENGEGKTLGVWMEDPSFRPHFVGAARSAKGFAPYFEINTLMPFGDKTEISAPEVLFQVFPGGWKAAATPFRQYYARQFRKETAVRDGVAWAQKIGVLTGVEARIPADADLKKIADLYGRDKVLLMVWNARAPGWDQNLPDWTPREHYVDGVRRAHENGIRVMAYVNICCANWQSEAWKRYGLDKFFLTRKNSLYQYKDIKTKTRAKAMSIGNNDYSNAPDLMQGFTPGKLLYGDLLSPGWREFHARLMRQWNKETGTDANYEDTSGTTGDHGNGTVNGLSAGQGDAVGDAEQIRLLQRTQPQVPSAGEFAPAPVAFGILWPLNYPTVYGNHPFRVSRLHRQVPLTDYLYGYRQLLTDNRGYSDFLKYLQGAVGDSVGGFGFISSDFILRKTLPEIQESRTFDGLLHRRALLFCRKELQQYFPEGDYPKNISCMYRGTDGIYSFYDDGHLQKMTGPDGKAVYGRVNGISRVETELAPVNWPFRSGKILSGLDPKAYYALFPEKDDTAFSAETLPEHVFLTRYFETPDAAYLELDSDRLKETELTLKVRDGFETCLANGKPWKPGSPLKAKLPLRIIAFGRNAGKAFAFPVLASGQMCGKPAEYEKLPVKQVKKREMRLLNGEDSVLAIPVKITGENLVFEAIVQDGSNIFMHPHDGIVLRLKINGETVKEIDTTRGVTPTWTGDREARKLMFDQRPRKWTIPIGKQFGKGETVLVSIECGSRENYRGDQALVMYNLIERN